MNLGDYRFWSLILVENSFLLRFGHKGPKKSGIVKTVKTGLTQACPKYQNSKFVISLQYFKREGRNEVEFLHADKHTTVLQVDTINLGEHGQSRYPK